MILQVWADLETGLAKVRAVLETVAAAGGTSGDAAHLALLSMRAPVTAG